MDYFEVNIASIKQNRNEIFEKIVSNDQEHISASKIKIISAKAVYGENYFLVQKDNNLHRLNSSYSPSNEASKWVEQFSFINMNVVISLFGLGSGVFARELINNKGENDVLLVYEPSIEVFLYVLHSYDITDIIKDNSVMLAIEGINEFEFHKTLQATVNITNLYSQITCKHPGYEELFPESAIRFWKEIVDNYSYVRININTEQVFGKRVITNALYNLRFLKNSSRLMDIKEHLDLDIPAVIIAAGPSLQENIEELKRAKCKVYIFVVDRILDYILDAGIEPDFIVTIDPHKPLDYFTKKADINIPLLCDIDSNWEILNQHSGEKIIYCCAPYFQRMYMYAEKEPPFINAGASVATAAFSVCIELGFNKIVLVGQDLAYNGELTHVGGVSEKVALGQEIYVEGIDGEKVRSRYDWYEFLKWFQDIITLHPEINVIDTKNKGAKIKGSIQMSLKSVVDKYGKNNTIKNNIITKESGTFSENEMESIRKYISNSYDELSILTKKAKDAIKISEEQISIYKINYGETKASMKNLKRISEINKYIMEQPVYYLLETFITAETAQQISEIYRFTNDEQQDKIETYKKSIKIFKAIIDGVKFVKEVFEDNMEYI